MKYDHVLIIDYNTSRIKELEAMMRSTKYHVDTYLSIDQMYVALEQSEPSALFLASNMPDGDTLTVCKMMKKSKKWASIPVIILGDAPDDRVMKKAFEEGADDFVYPPFHGSELIARLHAHVKLHYSREELEATKARVRELEQHMILKDKELKDAKNKANGAMIFDPLTSLYNRSYMLERLEDESIRYNRYGSHFTILLIDIDDFARVNERYGDESGDMVLRQLAESIASCGRQQDILSRWGGKQFLALLPETGVEGAHVLAERIRRVVREHHYGTGDQKMRLTVTIGIAMHSTSLRILELVQQAVDAMEDGKRSGKDQTVVWDA